MVLGCITDGHKATAAAKDKSSAARAGLGVILSESDHHRRISDMIFDDDVDQEMELREMLEADEIREEELFRSRAVLGAPGRGRAELEIRMQRLRRAKIARLQRDLHRDELELRYRAIWRLEHASKEVPTGSGIAKTAVRGMRVW
jgi:hypothetical protein